MRKLPFLLLVLLAFSLMPVLTVRGDTLYSPDDLAINAAGNYYLGGDHLDHTGDFLVVQSDNIVLDGMGYTWRGTGSSSGWAIYFVDMTNIWIKNLNIENCTGTETGPFADTVNITFTNCNFLNTGVGFLNVNTQQVTFEDCTFTNVGSPIGINSCNLTVRDCEIDSATAYGISIYHSTQTTITNTIINNVSLAAGYGALKILDSNVTATGNTITDCYSVVSWLSCNPDTYNTVTLESNWFSGNNSTFYFDNEYSLVETFNFYDNYVCDNYTVDSWSYAINSALFDFTQPRAAGNRIYTTGDLGGNYWATPNGTGASQIYNDDQNHDAFVDAPVIIFGTATDYLAYTFLSADELFNSLVWFAIYLSMTLGLGLFLYYLTKSKWGFFLGVFAGMIVLYVMMPEMNQYLWAFILIGAALIIAVFAGEHYGGTET